MDTTIIEDLRIVPRSIHRDERGTFTRLFDSEMFVPISGASFQINLSRNPKAFTLRGMHYQVQGSPEHKVLTVLTGSIFLAIVDLRKGKSTYLNTLCSEILESDEFSLFIPAGCAAGWLSLSDDAEIHYVMYSRYEENSYSGIRYNDPYFAIQWPSNPKIISSQDRNWPLFDLTS